MFKGPSYPNHPFYTTLFKTAIICGTDKKNTEYKLFDATKNRTNYIASYKLSKEQYQKISVVKYLKFSNEQFVSLQSQGPFLLNTTAVYLGFH